MVDSKRGGSYSKGRHKRREIIDEATRIFSQEGFNHSNMGEIARACNLSRTGLLHYFPSKQSLLLTVLQEREKEDEKLFQEDHLGDSDGLNNLRRLVELAGQNSRKPWAIGLFTTLSAEATDKTHPAHGYFVARYRKLHQKTLAILRKVQDQGSLRNDVDIETLAINLNALMDGLQLQWLLNPQEVNVPDLLTQEIELYLTVPLFPHSSHGKE